MMTTAQKVLKKWIDQNFAGASVSYPTNGSAAIKDREGGCMTVTLNLYCDIMEKETHKILAVSDLPHDLPALGYSLPGEWTELRCKKDGDKHEKTSTRTD